MVGIARTGDDCHAVLQVPAQDDLCRGFAVRLGNLFDGFVAEHRLCIASAAEGIPPLDDNTVAVHIRHIREKIEINPKEPRYLKVVWGVGYKIDKEQA